MSISKTLWNFFSEPVEETPDQSTDEQAIQKQQQSQSVQEQADAIQQEAVQQQEATTDADLDKGGEDDEYEWAAARDQLDKDYWPYTFTPDGPTESIGADQTLQIGTQPDGAEEAYAGQWVREMFEAHDQRPDDNTWVGYTQDNVRGVQEAGIEYDSLFRHMAFFGMTGYGKSTVLKNLMVQWAFMGHGFCFVDPKGQDILDLLQLLPEDRLDDVVWVEPGNEELDKAVGFNFFDTRHDPGDNGFENEVQEIVNDFVAILRQDGSWGATMDAVAKSVTTQLVRAQEENFTVLDMYQILSDEDERAAFAEQYGDAIEQVYLKRLKENYDDEEFDPLLRRIREWVENRITREMVAHRESSVNIGDVVEEGKILLVRTSSIPSQEVMSLVATSIVRRIWATIRTRANMEEDEYDPFFIVMDEFDMLTNGEMDIGDMFSKGRSLELSVCVANQQPTQLPEEVQEALNNCDNLFTFNPGQNNIQDAKNLGKSFDVDMMELFELSQFSLLGRFTVDGNKTDAILVDTFAPYPPRRTDMVADAVMQRSIQRYGADRLNKDFDFGTFGILGREQAEEENEDTIEVEKGELITIPQVLEAVHTAGIRNDSQEINGKTGWTSIDNVRTEVTKYTDAIEDGVALDNILEQIPSTLLESATMGEETYFRLSPEGEQKAFVQDTGRSSSGGKAGHRHLLKKGYEAFTQLGYSVSLPTQEGGEQPDGIATPPIQPMKESETFEEAEKLKEKLSRNYPRATELFGDSTVALEAESTTITKPKQTIKNLAKAMEQDQKCAFLVKDGSESKGTFEYWARAGHRILSDPPFVSYKDADENRRFYNHAVDSPVKLSNGAFALQKATDQNTVWRDDGDRIVLEDPDNRIKNTDTDTIYTYTYSQNGDITLRDPDGNEYNTRFPSWSALKASGDFEETNIPLAIFKETNELKEPSASKFPYNYSYNQSGKEYIVRDERGNTIDTYNNKDDMREDYDIIPKPVIPENIFPSGNYPDKNDWLFIIIPDANKDIGPQLYLGTDDSGNSIIKPLFDGDEPYDAIQHNTPTHPDDDTDDDDNTTPTQTENEDDTPEPIPDPRDDDDDDGTPSRPDPLSLTNDDEEVPVSDGTKPKSTNEVIKESGEEWVQPEPGDDDYDPTKDGKNFRAGHDDDFAQAGDGGQARQEDDGSMKGYKTPDEKKEEKLREEYAKEHGIGDEHSAPTDDTPETQNTETENTPEPETPETNKNTETPTDTDTNEDTEPNDTETDDTDSTPNDDSTDPFDKKGLGNKRLTRKQKARKQRETETNQETDDTDE